MYFVFFLRQGIIYRPAAGHGSSSLSGFALLCQSRCSSVLRPHGGSVLLHLPAHQYCPFLLSQVPQILQIWSLVNPSSIYTCPWGFKARSVAVLVTVTPIYRWWMIRLGKGPGPASDKRLCRVLQVHVFSSLCISALRVENLRHSIESLNIDPLIAYGGYDKSKYGVLMVFL